MTENFQLRQVIPYLQVGGQTIAYDLKLKDISGVCMRLRRGTEKYWTCKTIPAGVLIRRVE